MFTFKIPNTKIEINYIILFVGIIFFINGKIAFYLMGFFFVFLHEISHYLMVVMLNHEIERMEFNIWGGVLHLKDYVIKPSYEILVLIIGPTLNLLIALLFYVFWGSSESEMINEVIYINTVLGIFNLIPIAPLDGGKIIRLYLSYFLGYGKAIKITLFFSKIFSIILFIFGIYLLQYDILNMILCFVAINIYISSNKESQFVLYKIIRYMDITDQERPSKYVVCKMNHKIKNAVDTFNPSNKRIFTIVNEKGKYRGQLSEVDLLKGILKYGIYSDFKKILELKNKR